jgi:large subunit ribosomal protein L31
MKTTIHPKQNETKVICSCGNTFETKSIKDKIHVEVCYKCHPFYTGEHRFLDTKGRVENFQKKQKVAEQMKSVLAAKKQKKEHKEERQTKSLRELLGEV